MRIIRLFYFFLVAVVYAPLLMNGGFGTSDDLALLVGFEDGFWEELLTSLSRSGHISRPIYALVQVGSFYLFGEEAMYYSGFRLALWFLSAFVLFKCFLPVIGQRSSWIFLLLFSFPIFTSAHLLNCFQTGYLLALLFWSLSIYVVVKGYSNAHWRTILLSNSLLLLSLLSCEILFPLFVLNIAFPAIMKMKKGLERIGICKDPFFKRNVFSVALLVCAYVLFKFSISAIIGGASTPYGVAIGTSSIFQALYFFVSILAGIPLLLFETGQQFTDIDRVWSALFILPGLYIMLNKVSAIPQGLTSVPSVNAVLIFSLALCSLVFLLSGYPAVTYGNYNKMMLPAFVIICLLLGVLFSKALNGKAFLLAIPVIFLWVFSMNIQVANFNRSWEIRKHVLLDLTMRLNETTLGKDPVVIANVPYFTKSDLNNEHVFWLDWDFRAGAQYFGSKKEVELFPFCHRTLMDSSVYPLHNVNGFIGNRDIENLWVYEIEEDRTPSSLHKIDDLRSYKQFREQVPMNDHRVIPRVQLRQNLKNMIRAEGY